MYPSGQGALRSPAGVGVGCPVVPVAVVEGPEPGPVHILAAFAADLYPDQELPERVGHLPDLRVAGGAGSFVEGEHGEVAGVEHVGDRVSVPEYEWCFVLSVVCIAPFRPERSLRRVSQLLADRPALDLVPGDVGGYPLEPGPVLLCRADPVEPCQRKDHPGPFLLDPVGPVPEVGVGGHGHGYSFFSLVEVLAVAGVGILPEIAGPEPALKMGVRVDGLPVAVVVESVGLDVLLVKPGAAESVLPRGVEVGLDRGVQVLVPSVGTKYPGGEDGAEDGARVVVAVIDPFVGICPAEEAIGRASGIAPWTVLELLERIVGQALRNPSVLLVPK